jgi:hypothetical protein
MLHWDWGNAPLDTHRDWGDAPLATLWDWGDAPLATLWLWGDAPSKDFLHQCPPRKLVFCCWYCCYPALSSKVQNWLTLLHSK